jgi:hypothetical protein
VGRSARQHEGPGTLRRNHGLDSSYAGNVTKSEEWPVRVNSVLSSGWLHDQNYGRISPVGIRFVQINDLQGHWR